MSCCKCDCEDDNWVGKPWGSYTILSATDQWKIKKLLIKAGQQISYQLHYDRDELWKIISGEGLLTLDGYQLEMKKDDYINIFAQQKHRIKNTSAEHDLIIIEIQTGDYLGEDDIVRIEDDYNRIK